MGLAGVVSPPRRNADPSRRRLHQHQFPQSSGTAGAWLDDLPGIEKMVSMGILRHAQASGLSRRDTPIELETLILFGMNYRSSAIPFEGVAAQ
jgi:hypothetical protein